MKLWSSSFSQDGQRIPRMYVSLGVLWFSLLVSFLATLAFKHLWCTLFLNLMKADTWMWPLASWMCKYSTLPNSRAYVVFHGMLVTSAGTGTQTEFNTQSTLNCGCGPLLHEYVNISHYPIPEPMWFSMACWSPLQVQVHKLNSISNLKPSMYECRGLCLKLSQS